MRTTPVLRGPARHVTGPCRSCQGPGLELVLDLGLQPVADWLVGPDDPPADERKYPLTLMTCRRCVLLQLAAFDGEEDVRGHRHESAVSSTVAAHDSAWAEEMMLRLGLGPASVVVEESDGGGGVARALGARGVRVATRDQCAPRSADVVIANHSLAHSPDLARAVTGCDGADRGAGYRAYRGGRVSQRGQDVGRDAVPFDLSPSPPVSLARCPGRGFRATRIQRHRGRRDLRAWGLRPNLRERGC